ncbi:unnamed protein product [Mytilus edulis]|uniref:Reverse transcriptase zinc-binding domain-containing protein n=1 Tax=Mytilus edulis TaxID=6550 RepID=A0A8S3PZZ7_MYTED|nr:unnamed protein product [Mytilus edulis]
MEAVENVLNSEETLSLDTSMHVTIGNITVPKGSGRLPIIRLKGASNSMALKRSILQDACRNKSRNREAVSEGKGKSISSETKPDRGHSRNSITARRPTKKNNPPLYTRNQILQNAVQPPDVNLEEISTSTTIYNGNDEIRTSINTLSKAVSDLKDHLTSVSDTVKSLKKQSDFSMEDQIQQQNTVQGDIMTLKFMDHKYNIGSVHPLAISVSANLKDIRKIPVRLKISTGNYILQTHKASFSKNNYISPTCKLCSKADETVEHFILLCEKLEETRIPL